MDSLVGKQLSVKEAAAMAGCERDSILRAIHNKKLRAWKLDTGCGRGRHETWRIDLNDLIRWMRRNANWN